FKLLVLQKFRPLSVGVLIIASSWEHQCSGVSVPSVGKMGLGPECRLE
ncbi:hypothetical protein CDAR_173581, partial [Caerostris darwini]